MKIASGTTLKTSASILTSREISPCLTSRQASLLRRPAKVTNPVLYQLVFEEIDDTIASSNQPDVVRLVDCNRRRPSEAKYRNDENVLLSLPGEYRPIETGEVPPPGEYSTDSGLIVPAVSLDLRSRLEVVMTAKGFGLERVTEMVARAGSELALQLIGGAHR